jgi:hypothetical protein
MDTGPAVQGRVLDLYMWSCHEALAFGRKPVDVTVLRLGWNPSASSASLIDRLFRRREAARSASPALSAAPSAALPAGPVPETAAPPQAPDAETAIGAAAAPTAGTSPPPAGLP